MATITEHNIDDFPGWKRMEIKTDEGTSKRQYKSPGGTVISNGKWAKLKLDHPGATSFTEAEVKEYAMKSRDEISVSSYNTSNLAIESGAEEYEWEEEPANTEPPPPKQQYVSNEGKKFFPRRKKARRGYHPDPSANRMKDFYQDVSQQQQQQQREKITDFPLPEVEPNKGFRKNPDNNAASAKELAVGLKAVIGTANDVEVMLLDERLILSDLERTAMGVAIGNLLEPTWVNKRYGTVVAGSGNWQIIGQIMIPHSIAMWMIIKEKMELSALRKQGLTNPVQQQPNASQQSQAVTWEQQQQQKQANNAAQPTGQNSDGRPIYGQTPFTNRNRGGPPTNIPPLGGI